MVMSSVGTMHPLMPMNLRRTLAAARVPVIGLAFVVGLYMNIRLWFDLGHGGVDFNQFYAASKLAGTGRLYDWDSLSALEAERGPPCLPAGSCRCVRPETTHMVAICVGAIDLRIASVAALLGVCFIWPGLKRSLILLSFAWSASATYTIALEQDTVFWMLFFATGMALLERGRTALAGMMFALCICKYHLAFPLLVLLIVQRRWNTLIAGALTTAALLAACFAIEGPGWPHAYLRFAARPDFSPGARDMPNLNGLTSWLSGAPSPEISVAVVCILLLWFVSRRASPVFAGAATMAWATPESPRIHWRLLVAGSVGGGCVSIESFPLMATRLGCTHGDTRAHVRGRIGETLHRPNRAGRVRAFCDGHGVLASEAVCTTACFCSGFNRRCRRNPRPALGTVTRFRQFEFTLGGAAQAPSGEAAKA